MKIDLYEIYYDAMKILDAGEIESAKKLLRSILRQDINFIDAYNGLVLVYMDEGDNEKAKEYAGLAYKKTRKIFSKWPKDMHWGDIDNRKYLRAICNEAIYLHEGGEIEKAEELYKLLLKMNPSDNQGVRYLLAALYAGEPPKIIEELMEEGNLKQDWSKIENLLEEQNKKHKFWKI